MFSVVSEFGFVHEKRTLVWFSQFPALLEKLRKLHVLLIVLSLCWDQQFVPRWLISHLADVWQNNVLTSSLLSCHLLYLISFSAGSLARWTAWVFDAIVVCLLQWGGGAEGLLSLWTSCNCSVALCLDLFQTTSPDATDTQRAWHCLVQLPGSYIWRYYSAVTLKCSFLCIRP